MRRLMLLLPLWLVCLASELAAHPCRAHGNHAAAADVVTTDASHAHHAAQPSSAPADAHLACTCLGACSATSNFTVATPATTVATSVVHIDDRQVFGLLLDGAEHSQLRLPFSTAPPV